MLWLLELNHEYWGWDCLEAVVVRAATERAARELVEASDKAGDEGDGAWLDRSKTTCERLSHTGEPGIIVADFKEA